LKRKAKLDLTFKDVETNENLSTLINCLNESDNLDINIFKNSEIFNNIDLNRYLKKARSIYFSKHKLFILTTDRSLYICDSLFFHVNEIELDSYDITQIVYNGSHVMVLTSNGLIYSWGRNKFGQLGNGTANNNYEPKVISYLRDKIFVKVCSSYEHSVALTSLELFTRGVLTTSVRSVALNRKIN
jgi:alpha-tubulin suppressor-like RCC1 family protein